MAGLTLADAARLSNDKLLVGIIDTIIEESPILGGVGPGARRRALPFLELSGTSLTFNRESTTGNVDWVDPDDTWASTPPTFSQAQATLKILGGDVDIPEFERRTYGNVQNIEAVVIAEKAKAIARTFEDAFIYGDSAVVTKQFDGLHKLIPSGQTVNMSSNGTPAAGKLTSLDEMMDKVRAASGKPDLLVMSRRTRRALNALAHASGSPVAYEPGDFGGRVMFYDGIPVAVCDYITDTEALDGSGNYDGKTGGSGSSIFAVKFGPKALCGVQNGGIEAIRVGDLETKDARRTRIRWYCGLVLFNTLAAAKLTGLSNAAFTVS